MKTRGWSEGGSVFRVSYASKKKVLSQDSTPASLANWPNSLELPRVAPN